MTQGRAIRQLETREHKWQTTDRKNAHIQVTRWRENLSVWRSNHAEHEVHDWIRLSNTGRAAVRNVTWAIDHVDNPVRSDHPGTFEVLC